MYAIKFVPPDKGIPGWLCNARGDVALFSRTLASALYSAAVAVLPGIVLDVYLYVDRYPDSPITFPLSVESLMNYA